MKAKIAVATVSGKAYYFLVNELKRKKLQFLSLKPSDPVPLDIEVVLTTEKERSHVSYPNVLVYRDESDPAEVVAEAARIVQGKTSYEKVVVGIDPGKTFGIAVLGDGRVIETANSSSAEETSRIVEDVLRKTPWKASVVRIGDAAVTYADELVRLLDADLPESVSLEMVEEAGTTRLSSELPNRKGARDVISAIRIAGRFGRPVRRRRSEKRE